MKNTAKFNEHKTDNYLKRTVLPYVIVYVAFVVGQESGCDAILSWQCKNGECIGIGERCNGIADCSDGSDETVRECISFQCSEEQFRCTYGACVNKTAECDGSKDCHDNSGISQFISIGRLSCIQIEFA